MLFECVMVCGVRPINIKILQFHLMVCGMSLHFPIWRSFRGVDPFLPPDVGLEPTTTSLKGWRSTD